ncbi:putative membrane protein [Ordospora colligata]|nr:putative membrane protein [Ordospora colligata]TBU17849.1 putative membrane protein [Ordospora colligata]
MSDGFILRQMLMIPPITRCMILAIGALNLLVCLEVISPYSLYYSPLFLKKLEVWRVITTFMYFGRPTLDVFMHIIFLYRYSYMLESGCRGISEYFWLIVVISGVLFVISNIYSIPILGASFSATITYIWTKRNPRAMVQIFGFISFPAFYLPFILPGFTLISRKFVSIDDVLGIFVGHLFYYFKDVYPRWGRDALRTPCFIKKLFDEHPKQCCKSKKGITIKEGRMRAEKMKNSTSEQKSESTSNSDNIKSVSEHMDNLKSTCEQESDINSANELESKPICNVDDINSRSEQTNGINTNHINSTCKQESEYTSDINSTCEQESNHINACDIPTEQIKKDNTVLDEIPETINTEPVIVQKAQNEEVESINSIPLIKAVDNENDALVASSEAFLSMDSIESKPVSDEPSHSKEDYEDDWDDTWGMESNDENSD